MDSMETVALEHKAITEQENDELVSRFMEALNEFKSENDRRLSEIERRGTSDVVTEEKLRRIEARMDGLTSDVIQSRRPPLEASTDANEVALEIRSAFQGYVRKGRTEELDSLGKKGLQVGSESDGGFLVSPEVERRLERKLLTDSPIRSIARTIQVSSSVFKRPFVKSGAAAGWIAETGSRPETNAPQLGELSIPLMELYAMPAATKPLLDDAMFDVEEWLASELDSSFGEQETAAFVNGNGVASPKGFLAYPRQKTSNPDQGKIGYVSTGAVGAFSPTAPIDPLFDLVHSLPQRYRKNGTFVMNRMTLSEIRRMKDNNGEYVFQPRFSDGLELRLLGYPIVECDEMPEIAAGSASIAFGDFQRGYLIADRQGIQILRDPYSAKPYVLFYATRRVGGGVSDSSAIRLLTFAA